MLDCVIAAAGASSRMCAASGEPVLKALLPFAGATLVETAAGAALGAGCRVLLVVGHRAAEVAAPFKADAYLPARREGRILIIENPRWAEGLLGSIQAALPRVAGEAFFLALADMPYVAAAAYEAIAAARTAAAGTADGPGSALLASHGGRRGHPVLLPSAWIPEILALDPRGMLRDYISGKPARLVETGPGALRDIDTRQEYLASTEGP